jgi:biotin operon repressor
MSALADLEKLRSEIVALESRLGQLEEPGLATSMEGLSTNEILGQIQKTTELERARMEERQNIQLALPVLRQRLAEMEKECARTKQQLKKTMADYEKLATQLKSSLESVLAQIDELKSQGMKAQSLYQSAYGSDFSRSPVWIDNWPHRHDFPLIVITSSDDAVRVTLTTEGMRSAYYRQ